MAALYGFAGVYSGRSAIEVVKHYGPAYLTAVYRSMALSFSSLTPCFSA